MTKVILYISAFVPMYALFLINLIVELLNDNLHFNVTNTVVLVALVVLIMVGLIGLMVIINKKDNKTETITVLSKKNLTDQHFLNYFSLFVLLALTFDISKFCYISMLLVIMIFIGVVYIRNNIFYINPLLNIMGYSFYDITYKDNGGEIKEIRIFYKGELKLNKQKYQLNFSTKNLNFLIKNHNK